MSRESLNAMIQQLMSLLALPCVTSRHWSGDGARAGHRWRACHSHLALCCCRREGGAGAQGVRREGSQQLCSRAWMHAVLM